MKNRRLNQFRVPVIGVDGYRKTVMLDFDNTKFKDIRYWADRTKKWFKLGGYLILKSSEGSYHVVFDRAVSWPKNVHIMNWMAHEYCLTNKIALPPLVRYVLLQGIKEDSTLRVGWKGDKPPPRVVCREGSQGDRIRYFLSARRFLKKLLRKDIKLPNCSHINCVSKHLDYQQDC